MNSWGSQDQSQEATEKYIDSMRESLKTDGLIGLSGIHFTSPR